MADSEYAIVEVEIGGDTHQLQWPRLQSLLNTLQASKEVDPPFSCEVGKCGACVCSISEGDVFLADNEVLAPEDVADGYILACRAMPKSDFIKVTF